MGCGLLVRKRNNLKKEWCGNNIEEGESRKNKLDVWRRKNIIDGMGIEKSREEIERKKIGKML